MGYFPKILSYLFIFFIVIFQINAQKIKLGIDVLVENDFSILKNKKIGLLTNQSGRNSKGVLTAEILAKTDKLKLKYIFVPEHGLFGDIPAGKKVGDESYCGVQVISLYGENKSPSKKHLNGLDALVVDIQDIGIRSYTFLSSVYYFIKSAAENQIPVYILDRPNPLGGNVVDGNVLEPNKTSFVGIIPIPYVHGMTLGEISQMIVKEGWLGKNKQGKKLKAHIEIIPMQGWAREMCYEQTGLMWFPTSPHIPTIDAIRGAALVGIFGELGIFNIGIGTTLPFQYIGAPEFNSDSVLKVLENYSFEGVSFFKARFRPFYAKFKDQHCDGLIFKFECNQNFLPMKFGAQLIAAIKSVHPEFFNKTNVSNRSKEMFNKVTGTDEYFNSLFQDNDFSFISLYNKNLEQFLKIRNKYLIY